MTPPTPGSILLDHIRPFKMTQEEFAKHSRIHFVTLNRLIKGHQPITAQYAIVLAKIFSTEPEFWLHAQAAWDLHKHRVSLRGPLKGVKQKQFDMIERVGVMA